MLVSWTQENSDQRSEGLLSLNQLETVCLSDRGGREENQDCWGITHSIDGATVICVADGLGGHKGGRFAAHTAVSAVCDFVQSKQFSFEKPESLYRAFEKANQEILQLQEKILGFSNMRTTLVVLMMRDGLACWMHIGDVRLYWIRSGECLERTKDQSVPQMLVDLGEIALEDIAHHPERSKLLSSLGSSQQIKPKLIQGYRQLQRGDCFLLATDGLWEWLSDHEILQVIQNSDLKSLTHTLENLVRERAKSESYFDNYTFALVKVGEATKNLLYWYKTKFFSAREQS